MTEIQLKKRPKNPIIIEGFPGFGLVGTIATEYLLDHLETEMIGKILLEDQPAMVAIHENKLVEPMGLFYNEKYNLVIVHAINATAGSEWKIAGIIADLSTQLNAKEIICIEGVGSSSPSDQARTFFYSTSKEKAEIFTNMNMEPLNEGIIMGVTSALLLKIDNIPISCVFAETQTNLPDSKAASKVIEVLDKYLGLDIDPAPLLETAKQFEDKIKGIMNKSSIALKQKDMKQMSYVG